MRARIRQVVRSGRARRVVPAWLLLLALVRLAPAADTREAMVAVARDQLDTQQLTALGRRVLAAPEFAWRHAQTRHFVVHYENGIFAAKVARMAESFTAYLSNELQATQAWSGGRSHIFIFRSPKDWQVFLGGYHGGGMEWSYSMAEGAVLYLQQATDIGSSAEVLGHEMTHVVVNRLLPGRLPLWLNEGLAEWFGEFAYADFKGVKKSVRGAFAGLRSDYPLSALLAAERYPAEAAEVAVYYDTAKHLVAFLQLQPPPGRFVSFVKAVAGGAEVREELRAQYGFADEAALAAAFEKFRR